jgi:glycosyltransferase involved in cell wall biosynthesis
MEGFGYPPIEAMGYGKPVICSNVTSVPEICGDAAIYFSPLYESDIFRALSVLTSSNYDEYVAKSKIRYQQVSERQNADLKELIKMILEK